MFTVYRVRLDNSLTNKEHLNDFLELEMWLYRAHEVHGWSTVRVEHDVTKQYQIAHDVGTRYNVIERGSL
jgi:ABC-type sulfate/molybdate transport systems ATPase subunit